MEANIETLIIATISLVQSNQHTKHMYVLVNKVTLLTLPFAHFIVNKLRYQGQGVCVYVLMTIKHSGSPQLVLHAHGPLIL